MKRNLVYRDSQLRIKQLNDKYGDDILSINLVDSLLSGKHARYVIEQSGLYAKPEELIMLPEDIGYRGKRWLLSKCECVVIADQRAYHYISVRNGARMRVQARMNTSFFTVSKKTFSVSDALFSIPHLNFEYVVLAKDRDNEQKALSLDQVDVYRLYRDNVRVFFNRTNYLPSPPLDELGCI
jgi:hypothetical protein